MVEPNRRGPYAKGIQRRQQILDRALEVFDEAGFKNTSLRAIGDAIGVTHAALRHYFGSSEELLLEILRQADERAGAEVAGSAFGAADFAARMAEHSMRVPGLTALYNSMVARALESGNEHSKGFFVQRYERIRRLALLLLENGRRQGTVRDDISLETAAALVIAASDGLSAQWLLDPDADMRTGMRLLEQLLRPAS